MSLSKMSKNSILEGTISLTIATLLVKILGAIYKIPISHILGEEGMGYFNSAYTVYSFFYLMCTAGVPKAIMIICGDSDYKESKNYIVQVSTRFFAIIGIVLSLIFLLFSPTLSKIIGNPLADKSMISIAPSIFFAAVSGVYRGYFSYNVKFSHIAISQIIEGSVKLIFGLLLAVMSSTKYMPIYIISSYTISGATFGSIFGLAYLWIIYKHNNSRINPKQTISIDRYKIIKGIIKISFPIAVSAMVMSITNIIDLSIIMNCLQSIGFSKNQSTALYGNYTTYATPIFNMVLSLFVPITISYMPVLIKEKKSIDDFIRLLNDEINTSFFIFVPLIFGLCVYSEEILLILFEDGGVFLGSKLLVYLSVSFVFLIPLTILNCGLEAIGKVNYTMISILVGSLFKVVFGYLMIGSEVFGIYGAPLSTIISYMISFIISLLIAHKENIVPNLIKPFALPLINSFISIYAIYPIYVVLSRKFPIISFIISVISTMILYVLLNFAGGKLKNIKWNFPRKATTSDIS